MAWILLLGRAMRKQATLVAAALLTAQAAVAAPIIPKAVGLRLTENALGFVEREANQRPLDYFNPRISKPNVKCFDEVGVDAFTLSSLLDSAEMDFHETPSGLQVTAYIDFIDINGEIWGADSDTFDLCPSFGIELQQAYVSGIVFTADVKPWVDDQYNLFVEFNQPPQLFFDDVMIDVGGFPDFVEDLVLSQEFVQDFLMRKINEALAAKVPEMLSDPLFAGVFTGTAGPVDYRIGVAEIAIDQNGANTFLDIQVDAAAGSTPPSCVAAMAEPVFVKRGTSGLGEYGDSSMLEISLADAGVNEVIWAAWKSGMMCYDAEEHPLEMFRHVLEGINPMADEMLRYEISMAKPPEMLFENGEMKARMIGFHLEASALTPSGEEKLLLRVDADMTMGATIEVDRATNRVLFSMDAMDVQFDAIQSEILFSDSAKAEEDLKEFISGFVIPRMQNKMQRYEVTNAVFPASEYLVMLDFVEFREGHVVAGASLLRADDPSINHVAPDTFVENDPGLVEKTHVSIAFDGEDDDSETLLYSWRLDDGEWSAFTEKKEAELHALTEGPHTFEVKARDRWQNVDETPATAVFQVAAVTERDMMGGCGCSLDGSARAPSAGATAALLLAVAVGLSIRRRVA